MSMAFSAGKPTLVEQVISKLGYVKYLYYKYLDFFKRNPLDLDDLVDGLIYIHLKFQKDES